MKLTLATRGSPLARAQSAWVGKRLEELHPGLKVDFLFLKTSGDRFSLDRPEAPPEAAADSNVKAMFVKEIEEALLRGEADFGVHSAKDLPADLPEGLCIACYPPREDPRDAFIPGSCRTLAELGKGARLGTASLRRRIQLSLSRPGLEFVSLRGNVDTRLRKLREQGLAGLVLAEAGLRRLGLSTLAREMIPEDILVPAPGQGALALEARVDRADVRRLLEALSDEKTRTEVEVERAFLKAVGGGCSTPLGALARAEDSAGRLPTDSGSGTSSPEGSVVRLSVFWSRRDGSKPMRLNGSARRRPEELSSLVEGLAGRLKSETA